MAIRKLDRSFVPNNKEIRYLNKIFPQWTQSLIDFAKVYYPNSYADFNESSPGMMFIEMMAYVGDVLGYYIDSQFKENLIQYAEETDNIISIAQALGYKPKPSSAANTMVDIYQLCPSLNAGSNFEVDTRYLLKLSPNMIMSAPEYSGLTFRTLSEVNFNDPTDREITVYTVNGFNQPLTYLIKKRVRAVAGTVKTYDYTFGAASKFSTIELPDETVLEVMSVVDSNGFTWYEVDYLAQDLVMTNVNNGSPDILGKSVKPTYTIKLTRTPRRFVTRYTTDFKLQLNFGSGVIEDSDSTINLSSTKIATDEYQNFLASTALDPSDFLSSHSYGLSPSNVQMTITYAIGGGLDSNVPSNSITKINTYSINTDRSIFSVAENTLFEDVVDSLAVNNSTPAIGGKDQDSVEEIRQNALAFFNAQNRLVNDKDYTVRVYAMPPKYGSVAKAFVAQDAQINGVITAAQNAPTNGTFVNDVVGQNVVNLYLLGYDKNKKLTSLNDQIKNNIRTYLDQYRMLSDEIRITDAFVVNIGIDFRIAVFKSYNMNEVLARCIDTIKDFFDIDRWQINQPIILADLYNTLAIVDGVQSVIDVEVVNKYRYRDGGEYNDYLYDISSATSNGVVYPSLDPMIWEIKYTKNDIKGSARQ